MEMASYLAGERWSDHPKCTHPLVASVARLVNDNTSDHGRARLVGLIPSVVGLTSDDPRVDARIALQCATAALPIAPAERQKVMAVSALTSERALAALEARQLTDLQPSTIAALESVPRAAEWAREFVGRFEASADEFRRCAAPHIARMAVESIVESAAPDADARLHDLLVAVIEECESVRVAPAAPSPTEVAHHTAPQIA